MCLFIVPEILIKSYFSREEFSIFPNNLVYFWLCVLGSDFCIFLMIAANQSDLVIEVKELPNSKKIYEYSRLKSDINRYDIFNYIDTLQ